MRVTIQISEKQANILQWALEAYARAGMGQYFDALFGQTIPPTGTIEELREACYHLKCIMFPMMDQHSYPGISMTEERNKIAWEMYQTIRQVLAYQRHPEGGHTVAFDAPMRLTDEPLPKITVKP